MPQASPPNPHRTSKLPGFTAALALAEKDVGRTGHLTGAINVIIPVSTLEFLFQRFDMLEKQLDDLKPLESRGLASPGLSAALAGTDTADNSELAARVSALQKTIIEQNSLLSEMNNKCKLLLEDNVALKEALNNAHNAFTISPSVNREVPQSSGLPTANNRVNYTDKSNNNYNRVQYCSLDGLSGRSEYRSPMDGVNSGEFSQEILISNIYEGSDKQNLDVIHAILSTIHPSIERDNILSARLLRPDRQSTADSSESNRDRRRCPWVVRLSDRRLVNNIMYSKHKFTRFST